MLSQPSHDEDLGRQKRPNPGLKNTGLLGIALTLLPWLALVALFSLAPELPRVPGVQADIAAVAGHFIVYGVLAAIFYRLHMRIWSGEDRKPIDSASTAAGVAAVLGLAFEWSQHLFTSGRAFEVRDVVANGAGAVSVAAGLLYLETIGSKLKLVLPSVFAIGLAFIAFATASYLIWDPTLAYEGDHWHAPYRVVICGEAQPLFPLSVGPLHTRGDGVIHVQPRNSGVVGEKANLAAFFESSGGELTNTSMTLPSGETFTNGDRCPDGSIGVVSASQFNLRDSVRIKTTTKPANYLPRDGQLLLIEFSALPGN